MATPAELQQIQAELDRIRNEALRIQEQANLLQEPTAEPLPADATAATQPADQPVFEGPLPEGTTPTQEEEFRQTGGIAPPAAPTTPTLNTETSIVDFLKSIEQPSDFNSRAQLAVRLGIVPTVGQYIGSASQNIALLSAAKGFNFAAPVIAEEPVTTPAQEQLQEELKIEDEVTTDDVLDELATGEDLRLLLDENKRFRDELLATFQPSQVELDLQNRIADVRGRADDVITTAKSKILDLPIEGIAAAGFEARGAQISEQEALQLEILQREEANLLTRLGFEQEARKLRAAGAETSLGFIRDDINLQLQIEDRLDAEEQRLLENAANLREESRGTLAFLLESFAGADLDDLSQAQQDEIATIASSAGIPLSILVPAMAQVKKRLDFDNLMKKLQVDATLARARSAADDETSDFLKRKRELDAINAFIEANPNLTREVLRAQILPVASFTSNTELNAILDAQDVPKREDIWAASQKQLNDFVKDIADKTFGFEFFGIPGIREFGRSQEERDKIIATLSNLDMVPVKVVTSSGQERTIDKRVTQEQRDQLLRIFNELYPA